MKDKLPFTKQEFDQIYSKVPRLTVEILLHDSIKGTYLTLRGIEPCKGQWHLPGGTVYFGESLENAVKRIARREINIKVLSSNFVGFIEYPSHYKNKMDHPIGLVFLIDKFEGQLSTNDEAKMGKWFTKLPKPTHADQDIFLVNNNYLKR